MYMYLRTEVRGDFNIHGTKYFQDAVFHQKSKKHHIFLIFDEKQHPENIWFRGC